MRKGVCAGLIGAIVAAAAGAGRRASAGEEPSASGFEFGVRLGYSVPMGGVSGAGTQAFGGATLQTNGQDLSSDFTGQIPVMFDAGYRFDPHWYLGGLLAYGFAFVNSDKQPECSQGVSCSGHNVQIGANLHYHIAPSSNWDPWLGVGFGYEWATLSISVNNQSGDATLSGFQFVNVQFGVDGKLAPNAGLGPFVMFGLGQYSSVGASSGSASESIDIANQVFHEWLTFGFRAVYDVNH
jgi:hypothetical protein